MNPYFALLYLLSLVVSWYFVNYFADVDDTNLIVYTWKLACLTPALNTLVALILLMLYLDEEKQVFDSLKKHLADKPFKRKPK